MDEKELIPLNEENKPAEITEEDLRVVKDDINAVSKQIVHSYDVDETNALINTFNSYLVKKNVIRTKKLDELYDSVIEQILLRFRNRGGEFSNQDLLNYFDKVESALEKSSSRMVQVDNNPGYNLTQNNNNVTINLLDTFDQEQKENITDAIKSILAGAAASETFNPIASSILSQNDDNQEEIENNMFTTSYEDTTNEISEDEK